MGPDARLRPQPVNTTLMRCAGRDVKRQDCGRVGRFFMARRNRVAVKAKNDLPKVNIGTHLKLTIEE